MRQDNPILKAELPLAGETVLLAEDESLDPSDTEHVLSAAGARVLLAQNAYQATLVASQHKLTAAVIDLDIGDDTIGAIGALLQAASVPILLLVRSEAVPASDWKHASQARTADELIVLLAVRAAARPFPPQPHHT